MVIVPAVYLKVAFFAQYCIVNIRSDPGYKSPSVMMVDNTAVLGETGFLLPRTSAPIASLHNGEEVALLCAGTNNRLNISDTAIQHREAKGISDTGARQMEVCN